jgi:hypothetical protein
MMDLTLYASTIVIAPFWADADTTRSATEPELYGQVWYKHFPQENKFAVIWDKVGYYREQNDKLNTFQVVISDGNDPDMGINQNICFCYLDMQWTTGGASGGVDGFGGFSEEVGPATVGTNKGSEGIFGQYGRFNMPGIEFNGAFGGPSGVDYLDYRGAINASGALCFDNRNPNIPPIASGFPPNNELMIVCGVSVNLTLTFSSPEPQQTVEVTLPPDPPAGMSLTGNEDGKSSVSIDVLWAPTSSQSGTYKLDFVAIDSFEPAAVIELTLTIIVQPCNEPKCCEPIDPTSECPVVGPFCTPWRSPGKTDFMLDRTDSAAGGKSDAFSLFLSLTEYCLADESFPLLIRHRTEIVKNSPEEVTAAGYWFHYLNDRGAAYAFTVKEGYRAPELYCCVPTVDEVESVCFEPGNNIPTSFVLRVSNSHSSQGIFVFPFGFGEVELISGMTMTFQDVKNKIDAMPNPGKILVEEFVNGGTTQSPLMPAEYKFHVFNGEIGAVTVIRNRGSDCSCYAEVDADFNRLDIHGCFVPSMPFGKNDDGDTCYDIDKELGQKNPHPIKDLDLCGELDDPKPCAWEDMKAIAMAIGSIIGVYMRIDMFVGADNAVYVQEYTTNHNGGLRHCTAREEDGCLNSCFLGQLWKSKSPDESLKFGGPITTEPLFLSDYISLSPQDQCDVAISSVPNGRPYGPKC